MRLRPLPRFKYELKQYFALFSSRVVRAIVGLSESFLEVKITLSCKFHE